MLFLIKEKHQQYFALVILAHNAESFHTSDAIYLQPPLFGNQVTYPQRSIILE